MFLKWTLKLKIENELYSRFKQYFNNTLVLVGAGGHGKLVIISSYPASLRRITVLVNFQAILLIFSGETSSNRDLFFTEDVAKNIFRPPKFQHKKFTISFSLFGQN